MACGKTYDVVMVRHGQSKWNLENIFTGWVDCPLSERGEEEAHSAGKALKDGKFEFNLAFTSMLDRANKTLQYILQELGQCNIEIRKTWRLNERHYGGLTGLNKVETVEKFGEEQVMVWRRSFDIPPPVMNCDHPYYDELVNSPLYKDDPPRDQFPMTESLKLTIERTLPFWNDSIVPEIKAGKKIIIAAHGNSLRGIVKYLDDISDEAITTLNLPTGIPFIYTLDENMKPIPGGSMKFVGDPEVVKKAMEEVANQTKKK